MHMQDTGSQVRLQQNWKHIRQPDKGQGMQHNLDKKYQKFLFINFRNL